MLFPDEFHIGGSNPLKPRRPIPDRSLIFGDLTDIQPLTEHECGFLSYAIHMIVPDLFSLVASIGVLYLFFRRDIPEVYDPKDLSPPVEAIVHQGMFQLAWVILVVLLIGYMTAELFHVPVSIVAGLIAIFFLVAGGRTKVVRPWLVIREAPWSIVFFSIGMYVVVYGLRNVGLTSVLGRVIEGATHGGLFIGTLATGFSAAILSSVMNNMPTVMVDALAIHTTNTTGLMHQALVYANVIGCDLGPKITPIGSLATLLWLHVLSKKGVTITWGRYFRTGVVLTIPTLFVTLTGLYVWLVLVG